MQELLSNTKEYEKKFMKTWDMSEYEIMTDDGFVDLESLHETVEYDVYELKTSKYSLKCADNHIVFLSDFSEIFVKDLKIGDEIIVSDENNNPIIDLVESVDDLKYKERMYDFELKENSNKRYYTNGILSHNTQFAKILARQLFDSEDNLIRVDMSEYGEKFSSSRMFGAPPGYVGYEEGGQLTEKVRRKPYSIILFDEIEKAHPDIFNSLLQILDEGHITDGLGRKVDFKNTIIIMTSNLGVKQLKDFGVGLGFQTSSKSSSQNEQNKSIIQKALNKHFAPEFLNRLDDIIIFNSLEKEHLIKIVEIEISGLCKRINELGIDISISKKAKEFIADSGYDPQYGARPLKRAIQKYIEDPLSEMMIKNEIDKGDKLTISYKDKSKELLIKVKNKVEK
jgi:hypothetical protein